MVATELSRKQMLVLWEFFESSFDELIDANGGVIRGIPFWELKAFQDLFTFKSWQHWFNKVGYSGVYESFENDEPTIVPIYGEDGRYWYDCLQTYRDIELAEHQRVVYQVNRTALFDHLSELLALSPRRERCVVDRCIWYLGDFQLPNHLQFPIYVVSGLYRWIDLVRDYFQHITSPSIILSASRYFPTDLSLPRHIIVINLREVLLDIRHKVMTVARLFQPVAMEKERAGPVDNHPVFYDAKKQRLSIAGKPDWYIKGVRRAAVVNYLVEQYKAGKLNVPSKDIIDAIRLPDQHGGSVRMQSIFHGDQHWRVYIKSPRRGIYALDV